MKVFRKLGGVTDINIDTISIFTTLTPPSYPMPSILILCMQHLSILLPQLAQ